MCAAAKQKHCEELSDCIKSIYNHLWWCCATCNGNVLLLRKKWFSILHHIVNVHEWASSYKFHRCEHDDLSGESTAWLTLDSAAFKALEKIILDKKLVRDMDHMTLFCHTGSLENFHSVMLKYCLKRNNFSYRGMVASTHAASCVV